MGLTRDAAMVVAEMIRKLRARMDSMIRTATLRGASQGSSAFPGLQGSADVVADEEHQGVEVLEQYGFASQPPDGSVGVMLCPAGDTGHPIMLAPGSPSLRIEGLSSGEAAIYVGTVANGSRVVCRVDGSVEVQRLAPGLVRLGDPATVPALAIARVTDKTLLNASDIESINALITAWNATQPGGGPIVAIPATTLAAVTGLGTITSGSTGVVST